MLSINKIMCNLSSYLTLFIILLFTGCSQTDMKEFQNNTPKLDLFEFFAGETIAYGIFEDRFGNLKRQFRININGKIDNQILTLDEDFLYDDGEQAKRIWKIEKKIDNNQKIIYEGQADDEASLGKSAATGNPDRQGYWELG
mgnify:CR=1 FL=1